MWLQLKTIVRIEAALVLWPWRKTYSSPPKRILIVQGAKLGDMVCTTPLFRAVKKTYPNAYLAVMGGARNKELLADLRYVDEYIIQPKRFLETVQVMRSKRFDAACSTIPDPEITAACMMARIPLVVIPRMVGGKSLYESFSARFLSLFVMTVPHHVGNYVVREYLRILEPLGIVSEDTRKELGVSAQATERVRKVLIEKNVDPNKFLVGIAPSAGVHKVKSWGPKRFAEVANYLGKTHGAVIVVIAGPDEKEDADLMVANIDKKVEVINLQGALSIDELKSLISLLHLYISSDTGPIHIAEALDILSVDILGAVADGEISLESPLHKVVFAKERGEPAIHVMSASKYDEKKVRRQTDLVTVSMVTAAIEEVLG